MPTLLKERTINSPGIITFTHNEVLNGTSRSIKKMDELLLKKHREENWIFGVHVQGDLSYLGHWPLKPWQSFIMWPDKNASFTKRISKEVMLYQNCINFIPVFDNDLPAVQPKFWDICVISRASSIKRIVETMQMIRLLMNIRPALTVLLIVPDHRKSTKKWWDFKKQNKGLEYFKLPKKLFSAQELKQITFLSSVTEDFGNFPIDGRLVSDLLSKSRLLLFPSHLEGTPRAIAEALTVGTPCAISKNLKCGMHHLFDKESVIKLEDSPDVAAEQLNKALNEITSLVVDKSKYQALFGEKNNLEILKEELSQRLLSSGFVLEGNWYLANLHLRLACHGEKFNYQICDNPKFLETWFERIVKFHPEDEDNLFAGWEQA